MTEKELLTAYRQEMLKTQIKNRFTDEQMISYRQGFIDAIREYEQRRTAEVQPNQWISVDEKLPEDDRDCLVWYRCDTSFGKSESWGITHCSRCDWYTKHLDGDNIMVLYWQPLPKPPKEG